MQLIWLEFTDMSKTLVNQSINSPSLYSYIEKLDQPLPAFQILYDLCRYYLKYCRLAARAYVHAALILKQWGICIACPNFGILPAESDI